MRRYVAMVLIAALALSAGGCSGSEWGKKFIRKNKNAKKQPKIYQVRKYEQKPSPELYKKHYAYWRTWQSELLSDLGQNSKKDTRCIDEIVSNLRDMQRILVPEWGEKLQKYIDYVLGTRDTILYGDLSKFNRDSILHTLETVDRGVKREFCYSKVKDHLKKDLNADDAEAEGIEQPQPEATSAPSEDQKAGS